MSTTRSFAAAVVFLSAGLAGCSAEFERNPVSGEVRYNGRPIAEGVIYFDPENTATGQRAAGIIQDGKYTIASGEGVFAGKYRVRISAVDPASKAANPNEPVQIEATSGLPTGGPAPRELLPEKYNTKSQMTVEIPSGGKPDLNFTLD